MLTEKQIQEFQIIYKKKFGKEISSKKAYEQGIKLVNLMKIIIDNPINKSQRYIDIVKNPNKDN